MKLHIISLALVASVALARPIPGEASQLDTRTLVGDEYTVHNQVDNSVGKSTFSIDHNGDSSVRKGLLYDIVNNDQDNDDRFLRRSLLGDLLGSDSTSIENINDNSKHKETVNKHHNKDISIQEIEDAERRRRHRHRHHNGWDDGECFDRRSDEQHLERRGLLDGLLGSSHTSISNVNDNSKTTKTYNSHKNTHKDIRYRNHRGDRRFRKRDDDEEDLDEQDDEEYDEADEEEEEGEEEEEDVDAETKTQGEEAVKEEADKVVKNERRGLLGDSSTSIRNVNDNSKSSKTYNSYDSRKHHYDSRGSNCRRRHRHHRYDKRGSPMDAESVSDNSPQRGESLNVMDTETAKSTNNVERSIATEVETIEYEVEEPWTAKRNDNEKRSVSRTHIEFESVSKDGAEGASIAAEDGQALEKVEDHKRSLVTIQIINTNTNRNSREANLIYTVTPVRSRSSHKKGPSQPSAHRRHRSRAPDHPNKKQPQQQQQEVKHPMKGSKGGSNKGHHDSHRSFPQSKTGQEA
ncbi:hypothetical protein DFQ26_005231 [Actinomortierella ambigua]|nr:hypothetical protein DFQ26_005231 [Actinomortierella ambigua]